MSAGSSNLARASRQVLSQRSVASRSANVVTYRRTPVVRSFTTSRGSCQEEPTLHLPPLASRDPILYDTLRPQPQSAYVALAHRIKLISHKTDAGTRKRRIQALIQACTHPSYATLLQRAFDKFGEDANVGTGKGVIRSTLTEYGNEDTRVPKADRLDDQYLYSTPTPSHEGLSVLGNTLLGLIASEHLHLRYPNLPNRVIKAALSAYVGPNTLADVASELGLAAKGIVRWERKLGKLPNESRSRGRSITPKSLVNTDGEQSEKLLSRSVHADAMRSIVAVLLQEQGLSATRTFVETHLLSRTIPLITFLKFDNPKRTLSMLCKKLEKEAPQSRMMAETGRLSINPVFVVGVFSGTEKLGEGTGTAIRMAEYRAAEDALRRFYLQEARLSSIHLPSSTLDFDLDSASLGAEEGAAKMHTTIWDIDSPRERSITSAFQPSKIGQSEIVYGLKN